MNLTEYIENNYPELIEEHHRATTPFYYEPGVFYHPITNGYGCGGEGSNERFEIINGDYKKGVLLWCNMQSIDKPDYKVILTMDKAYTQMKRVDESIVPAGRKTPNSKRFIYFEHAGKNYVVSQGYWRYYDDSTLCCRITIYCEESETFKCYGQEKEPYWELYCHFGSTFHMKHIHSYDSVGREQYTFKKNISVREFKEFVFEDANVKFIDQNYEVL